MKRKQRDFLAAVDQAVLRLQDAGTPGFVGGLLIVVVLAASCLSLLMGLGNDGRPMQSSSVTWEM